MKLFRLIFIITLFMTGIAQATSIPYALMPAPRTQFFTTSGTLAPLSGGKVYFCQPGTTCGPTSVTLKDTYTDSTGGTANVNPVVLNSNGQANIWLKGFYKVALYDSAGNIQPGYPIDNVSSVNNSYIPPTGLPWVDASAYGSLAAALTALGTSTQAVLYVSTALTLTASAVVPANVNLVVLNTGSITVNSPYTLTISGPFYAGLYKAISGTGTVSGLKETRIEWFGGKGDGGTTDDTAAVAMAFNTNGDNGSHVVVTPGKSFKSTAPVVLHKNQVVDGGGTLLFTGTGDGLQSTWTKNTSTVANIAVRDITITSNNGSSTGGGFVDLAGAGVNLRNVTFNGFAYGTIFDQTTASSITGCVYNTQATASIWLVNGAEHTAGATALYTNEIAIEKNTFAPTAVGIADDGGYSHTFKDNQFTGGTTQIRFNQVYNAAISGGQFLASTAPSIRFYATKLGGGTGSASVSVSITNAYIYPTSGQYAVSAGSGTPTLGYFTFTNNIVNTSGIALNGIPANLSYPRLKGVYSAAVTYSTNDIVTYTGSSLNYISLQSSNLNHTPNAAPTYWQPVSSSSAVYSGNYSNANTQLGTGDVDSVINSGNPTPTGSIKAYASFGVPNLTGTYLQVGYGVAVTISNHGLSTGMRVLVSPTTGAATGGLYMATVTGPSSFTYTAPDTQSTSGNVTMVLYIRNSSNVSSIIWNSAGSYTVNLTNSLNDAFYTVIGNAKSVDNNVYDVYHLKSNFADQTVNSFSLMANSASALADPKVCFFIVVE